MHPSSGYSARVTWASLSTTGCLWVSMLHQFPAAATTNCDSCGLWSGVCRTMPPDYCNALFFSITNELFCRLQSVQNAAARLVTGAKRSDHISPVLRQLHWLPVRQRVVFKIATLVHRSLSGLARDTLPMIVSLSPTLEQGYCVLLTRGH